MFSFFGNKKEKKHSPGEHGDSGSLPPIPGPEDDFVVVNKRPNLPYPSMGNPAALYPSFNQPQFNNTASAGPKKEDNFLQGVPFSLNKEFTSGSRNDILAMQLSEIMAYCTRRLHVGSTDYEFRVERSVLSES